MNVELVGPYLEKRMLELGYGKNYTFRVRHLVLLPGEQRELEAWNELLLLLKESCDVRINSEFGVFDLSAEGITEQQHEHRGLVTLTNTSAASTVHLQLLQVIPLYQQQNKQPSNKQIKENSNGDYHH